MKQTIHHTLALIFLLNSSPTFGNCIITAEQVPSFNQLKAEKFVIQDQTRRHQTLLNFAACLNDADPVIRDEISLGGITNILRRDEIDTATRRQLKNQLVAQVEEVDNAIGVRRTFSILALAEVARNQRLKPFMSDDERQAIIDLATHYLSSLRDYRGFDPQIGWRHGIAHAADLAMQLILDTNTSQKQVEQLLAAIFSQIIPANAHIYIHGEAHRLARPVLFAAGRGVITETQWRQWLQAVSQPAPLNNWDEAFSSEKGLAQRHNARQFLLELYAGARESANPNLAAIATWVREYLRSIP